jgi:LPS sulfotransferase NodH
MNILNPIYFQVVLKARIKGLLNILPFYKHKKYTPFLILGHPRTGTSLLHTYLNSHSAILSLNEALAYTNDGKLLFHNYSKAIKVVGFKYFYEYILDAEKRNTLIQLVSDFKIKVLKIDRKNYLRTYISLKIAEKTKEWSSTGSTTFALKNKQLKLTKEECLTAFANYAAMEKETEVILKHYNIPVYTIEYEALDTNPIAVMNGVQEYLGVVPQTVFSLLTKQNPERISELILNYQELKNEFKGSEFESYFEA